uniref:Uncharacterized protein n=1 Tax=Dulem virus 39 TaxID=3145757 RepID=A0AAU8B5Y3_9CAUD
MSRKFLLLLYSKNKYKVFHKQNSLKGIVRNGGAFSRRKEN